jgi:glycosyltransferase involved in cell wall biosynthesis
VILSRALAKDADMNRLRIAHIILSRGFAGSERATAEMCNAHCEKHDVLLIIKKGHANSAGVTIRQWIDPRVKIVEVGNWFPRAGIARALEEFGAQVVHGHLRRSTKMLARIKPRAATLVTLHISVNGPHFADMDGIVCIARWQHEGIPRDYRGRVFDINLAYIPHRRLPPEEVQRLRAELGVKPDEFLVGGVGRLARSKGLDTLIEAWKAAGLEKSKLVILGEGRERPRLERLCAPGISLPGFVKNAKDYYQVFDVFVCPSRREPLPYVLLEALDAGVPIIASTALGNAELLEKYPGDLFTIEDVNALAALLRAHRANPKPKSPVPLPAFAMQTIADEYEAAYREVIARKAGTFAATEAAEPGRRAPS